MAAPTERSFGAGEPLQQLPGITGSRPQRDAPDYRTDELPGEAEAAPADDRHLELYAERVVLAREIDAAIASHRFEEAAQFRRSADGRFVARDRRSSRRVRRFTTSGGQKLQFKCDPEMQVGSQAAPIRFRTPARASPTSRRALLRQDERSVLLNRLHDPNRGGPALAADLEPGREAPRVEYA